MTSQDFRVEMENVSSFRRTPWMKNYAYIHLNIHKSFFKKKQANKKKFFF